MTDCKITASGAEYHASSHGETTRSAVRGRSFACRQLPRRAATPPGRAGCRGGRERSLLCSRPQHSDGCSVGPADEPLQPPANQRTGPPPSCPVKRKYLAETVGTNQSLEGRGHRSEGRYWLDLKDGDKASKLEEGFGLVRQAQCCHGYECLLSPPSDEPLALIKKRPGVSRETVTSQGPSTVQQTRPSVITHASSNQHRGGKAEDELNQSQQRGDSPPSDALTNTTCDAVVEEHFRRSLGASYQQPVPPSVSVSESVDAHFAKALGDRWIQVQAAGRSLTEGSQSESADTPSVSLP